jgi:hypothetical protein
VPDTEPITLKNGQLTYDRRLDRVPSRDDRSMQYPLRAILGGTITPVAKSWPLGPVTDQGREGACVGHGWTSDAMASPARVRIGNAWKKPTFLDDPSSWAYKVYRDAQKIDEWPGEDYGGTSVLAGAKIMQQRGLIGEYRWAQSITDVRDALITRGPVIIGIDWYDSMYETDAKGLVTVGGTVVGGHCLLVYGFNPALRIGGKVQAVYRWRNSWSTSYGVNGNGIIRAGDLEDLLNARWAEAAMPVQRYAKPQGVAA